MGKITWMTALGAAAVALLLVAGCSGGDAEKPAAGSVSGQDGHAGHQDMAMPAKGMPQDAHKGAGTLAAQTTCPIMGNPINKDVFVDHGGKRVYFCCAGCEETFNQDPEKYLKKLADLGQEPVNVPQE